jgi:hypothetical protein
MNLVTYLKFTLQSQHCSYDYDTIMTLGCLSKEEHIKRINLVLLFAHLAHLSLCLGFDEDWV